MIISTLRPAEVRHHLRGDIEKFDKADRFFLGLKKITKIDDGKHYRFCYICSKIQKYIDKKHLNPEYYEAKIDSKLRDLVQLVHDHISEVGPTEENFYEFILEAFGILSQNVRFNTDPYIRFLKIVIEEHAKFRATNNGELTAVSLIEFCTHLDAYVNAALKPVVPDWYHLFLGPQHPAAQLLFATRGKKEDKISPDTVKADIRSRMLDNVVEFFGKDLDPLEKKELKTALDRLAAQLKANPSSAQNLAELLANNDASKAGNPEFALIGMRLFNVKEALGKREVYDFAALKARGEPQMGYCHPFINDVRFYRNLEARLAEMEKNFEEVRRRVANQMALDGNEITLKLSYLEPFIKDVENELPELRQKASGYPTTLEAEAISCARQLVHIEAELAQLKAKMAPTATCQEALKATEAAFSALSKSSHERQLILARIKSREQKINEYKNLQKRAQRAIEKPGQLERMFRNYQAALKKELDAMQKKTYQLSRSQIEAIF
jgi:hypothetical protein